MDEDKLLKLIVKGNKKAFEELFLKYHKKIYAFSLKLLPYPADAEEIIQNVFMALWNQRSSLVISTTFNAYIFGIARNMISAYMRHKIREEAYMAYVLENITEYTFITEEELEFKELETIYNQLLDLLPERRREIFLLSRNTGLSYKEIAQKLGITENTVDTQIRLALNFLRSEISKKWNAC